jgi:hypothetical protein
MLHRYVARESVEIFEKFAYLNAAHGVGVQVAERSILSEIIGNNGSAAFHRLIQQDRGGLQVRSGGSSGSGRISWLTLALKQFPTEIPQLRYNRSLFEVCQLAVGLVTLRSFSFGGK